MGVAEEIISAEYFMVDSTLIEVWTSIKKFQSKVGVNGNFLRRVTPS